MGRSLFSLLKGEEVKIYPIFSESVVPDLINLRYDTSRFIVSCILGRWKLIYDYVRGTGKIELYDLERDFEERNNLVEEEPEAAAKLFD